MRDGKQQLIVPASLSSAIIALNHEPILAAHPGRSRILELMNLKTSSLVLGELIR
jgi:hypothetical protein